MTRAQRAYRDWVREVDASFDPAVATSGELAYDELRREIFLAGWKARAKFVWKERDEMRQHIESIEGKR